MAYADKSCYYPASEDFMYHLRPYVEEGNVEGIAQLAAQLNRLKKSKNTFDLNICTQYYVERFYQDIVDNRDEKSFKLIAPFMIEYGKKFLEAPVDAFSKRYLLRARWEADVASQVPGVMITEIKRNKAYKIARAWPLLPRTTQKRIQEEAKRYCADNCGELYSDDCREFEAKLAFIDSLDYAFRKICKIMPQELKHQEAAKQAAMKKQLAACESVHSELAETKRQLKEVTDNMSNNGKEATAPAGSVS